MAASAGWAASAGLGSSLVACIRVTQLRTAVSRDTVLADLKLDTRPAGRAEPPSEQAGISVLRMSSSSYPMEASRDEAQMYYLWSPDGDGLAPASAIPRPCRTGKIHFTLPGMPGWDAVLACVPEASALYSGGSQVGRSCPAWTW